MLKDLLIQLYVDLHTVRVTYSFELFNTRFISTKDLFVPMDGDKIDWFGIVAEYDSTLFNAHDGGVISVDLNPDSEHSYCFDFQSFLSEISWTGYDI